MRHKPIESKPLILGGIIRGSIHVRDFGESFRAVCIINRSPGNTTYILNEFLNTYGWGPRDGGPGRRFAGEVFIKRSRSRIAITWDGGLDV